MVEKYASPNQQTNQVKSLKMQVNNMLTVYVCSAKKWERWQLLSVEDNFWNLTIFNRRSIVSASSVSKLECDFAGWCHVMCDNVLCHFALTFCTIVRVWTLQCISNTASQMSQSRVYSQSLQTWTHSAKHNKPASSPAAYVYANFFTNAATFQSISSILQ